MSEEIKRIAGGIVLGDSGTVAVVRRRPGGWFFPKGHVEANETDEDAARREITEETGLTDLELIDDLGTYERPTIDANGAYVPPAKAIHMYLFAAPAHSTLRADNETEATQWLSLAHVAHELADAKDKAWFVTVFERVRQAIQRD